MEGSRNEESRKLRQKQVEDRNKNIKERYNVTFEGESIEDTLEKLQRQIKDIQKDKDYYRNKLNDFRANLEIGILEQEISQLTKDSIGFLTDEEKLKADEFRKKHNKTCRTAYSFIVTQTGMGDNIKIQCVKCKEIEDITDYDSW